MSFKSKQRAKHGHLFGDDPLSASLVSSSDDPLFGPKKVTNSISKSNVVNDPLSRLINDNPLESNNGSRRQVKSNGNLLSQSNSSSSINSNSSGSIFGDIDVSKLGAGSTNHKKTSTSTSLRSTATLRSSKLNLEEEEDLLFGGNRHSASRSKLAQQKANSSTSSTTTSTPTTINSPPSPLSTPNTMINEKKTVEKSSPKPKVQEPVKSDIPKQTKKLEEPLITEKKQEKTPVTVKQVEKKEEKLPVTVKEVEKKEEKPAVSTSSSFFKFFKSSNSNLKPSTTNSSSSSVSSINAPSPVIQTNNNNEDAVNTTADTTTTNTSTTTNINSLPTPRQATPPTIKQTNIYKNIKQIITKPNEKEEENEEEDEGEEIKPHIILDEATRAFAEDDLSTINTKSTYDYRSLSPELTMDALTINTNSKLNSSISAPTKADDLWSNIPVHDDFIVEPSMSSPLVVKVQDIEPQKRTAFADLIHSWNNGNSNDVKQSNTDDMFYDHIAEERRDVGFAGIEHKESSHNKSSIVDWDVHEEINPWN